MKKLIPLFGILFLLPGCAAVVVGTAATSVMVAQDKRTAGTIVEDKTIQMKTLRAISNVAGNDPDVHVTAVSFNNRVLLLGQAPTTQTRADIENAVRNIAKVKEIHNEVAIGDPSSPLVQSTDSLITAKIKSEMAITKDIHAGRIKVVTENGIVYLMGLVKPREEEIAVDIARYTKGVKKVVKLFEYDRA